MDELLERSNIAYTLTPFSSGWLLTTDKWLNGEGSDEKIQRGFHRNLSTAVDYILGLEKQALIEQNKRKIL
jgi:hypothetical protein